MKKKSIIIIILIILLVAAILTVAMIFSNKSYKSVVKDFAKACKSEEKMEKFIDENMDFRGAYTAFYFDSNIEIPEWGGIQFSNPFENFEENYKDVTKEQYKDEDYIKEIKETYMNFVGSDLKVKKIEKAEEWDECDKIDAVTVTLAIEDEEEEATFLFYKDKFIGIAEIYMVFRVDKTEY